VPSKIISKSQYLYVTVTWQTCGREHKKLAKKWQSDAKAARTTSIGKAERPRITSSESNVGAAKNRSTCYSCRAQSQSIHGGEHDATEPEDHYSTSLRKLADARTVTIKALSRMSCARNE
jgi:hypothetical protein